MPAADRVPFLPGRRLVTVRTILNEVDEIALVVDSGAERTIISHQVARRLGMDLDRPQRRESLTGVGQSPPVAVVRLESVRVAGKAVRGLEASVYDPPPVIRADGLLGLNYLRHFRITFAFDLSALILRERGRGRFRSPRRTG
jgi:predicted aspartyl protease